MPPVLSFVVWRRPLRIFFVAVIVAPGSPSLGVIPADLLSESFGRDHVRKRRKGRRRLLLQRDGIVLDNRGVTVGIIREVIVIAALDKTAGRGVRRRKKRRLPIFLRYRNHRQGRQMTHGRLSRSTFIIQIPSPSAMILRGQSRNKLVRSPSLPHRYRYVCGGICIVVLVACHGQLCCSLLSNQIPCVGVIEKQMPF